MLVADLKFRMVRQCSPYGVNNIIYNGKEHNTPNITQDCVHNEIRTMRGIGIRFTQLLYTLHLRNLLLFESIQTLFGIYFRRIKFRIHLDPE